MTFILRRSLTTSSHSITPLELFTKEKTSLAHMHTFGCDAHYFVHDPQRNKLEAKSKEGIFLGYVSYNPLYHLIYDLDSGRIIESLHTTFFDSKFTHMRRLNSIHYHSLKRLTLAKSYAESDTPSTLSPLR